MMNVKESNVKRFAALCLMAMASTAFCTAAQESSGLAPEVTDINAKDMSYGLEAKIPFLKQAFIDASPKDMKDGIPVGELGVDGGDKNSILTLARELADGDCTVDSFLVAYKGKLLLESYYRRGRINVPHFQMSITKSYTALAIGRAMQLGYLKYEDLGKPIVSFLKELDQSKLVPGAKAITLAVRTSEDFWGHTPICPLFASQGRYDDVQPRRRFPGAQHLPSSPSGIPACSPQAPSPSPHLWIIFARRPARQRNKQGWTGRVSAPD